jgi:hypothetical protein
MKKIIQHLNQGRQKSSRVFNTGPLEYKYITLALQKRNHHIMLLSNDNGVNSYK